MSSLQKIVALTGVSLLFIATIAFVIDSDPRDDVVRAANVVRSTDARALRASIVSHRAIEQRTAHNEIDTAAKVNDAPIDDDDETPRWPPPTPHARVSIGERNFALAEFRSGVADRAWLRAAVGLANAAAIESRRLTRGRRGLSVE